MIAATSNSETVLYTDPQITITKAQTVIRGKIYALTGDTTIEFSSRGGNYVAIAACLSSALAAWLLTESMPSGHC